MITTWIHHLAEVTEFSAANLAVILALVIGYGVHLLFKQRHHIPPGPIGLPLLGYTPFLGPKPQETFQRLEQKYGNIFSLYIGNRFTVVLNDYEAIKAAYLDNGDAFVNREPGFAHSVLNASENDKRIRGLTMSNGNQWRTLRRFALTTLRNIGMGKIYLQERILEEINLFTQTLQQLEFKPEDSYKLMISCTANIVFAVTFDQRFKHDDPNFKVIVDYLLIALPTLSNLGPVQFFPWLKDLPGRYRKSWEIFCNAKKRLREVLKEQLAFHQLNFGNGEVRDYVGAFLDRQEKERLISKHESFFDDDELMVNLQNLFGAGSETTASTIVWVYYFMVKYPEIQARVQRELDEKVTRDHPITMENKLSLPYLGAVCKEVQRVANVVPLSIARSVTYDVEIQGYLIPKGTYVIPNLWNVHRDSRYWSEPEQFNPDRFLNPQGQLMEPSWFVPFSLGKRDCLGKNLANMEIFLFVANVLQRFSMKLAPGCSLPSMESTFGLTARPPRIQILFEKRFLLELE